MNVVVDFESYYGKDLSIVEDGLYNYAEKTYAYLVSVVCDKFNFCGTPEQMVQMLGEGWWECPSLQFWAFNSNFDQTLWEKYFTPTAKPWQCISDLSAFHQLPRDLAGVVRTVFGKKVDKTLRDKMRNVHWDDLPDSEQSALLDYCLSDSVEEAGLLNHLAPMTDIESRVAMHTRMTSRRGIAVDSERVDVDMGHLTRLREDAYYNIPWTFDGEAPLSYPSFKKWCSVKGMEPPLSLDKRNEACTSWMRANPEGGRAIDAMRMFRGANTKLRKLETLKRTLNSDGIMPMNLLYCGARHTRRWSSTGFNVQNLDSAPAFVDEMNQWPEFADNQDAPGIYMRRYLVPRPGKVFGILDYTQIEPRMLNWFVGNHEMLAAMRAGYGIYEAHARATMGWTGEPGTMKVSDPKLYKFAKIRVLALGYGMGANLFQAQAALVGLDLTEDEAKQSVKAFRASNPLITGLWHNFDNLIRQASISKPATLRLQMPTGDYLDNYNIRIKGNGAGQRPGYQSFTIRGDYGQQSIQPRLWGGTLTENITQRMARDVMAETIVRLEDAGFPVIFHAHDEVILELDEATAEKDFRDAQQIMSINPEWCPDAPLEADGEIHRHYTKIA